MNEAFKVFGRSALKFENRNWHEIWTWNLAGRVVQIEEATLNID
jgi:hypothetical protein